MQVSRASGLLSLVAFSGLVEGPAWDGQDLEDFGSEEFGREEFGREEASNPEARRQPPKYYTMQAEEPCGTA